VQDPIKELINYMKNSWHEFRDDGDTTITDSLPFVDE